VKVKPVLGGWEIPRIAAIETRERRDFVELPVPGKVGSLFQDLNTTPTCVAVSGSLYGDEARDDFLDELRGKFRDGEPVTFVADIVTATAVQYVVIEALTLRESGEVPDQTDYRVVLRESPPPPPPPDPLGGLDAGLLDQAAGFLDAVGGALDLIDGLGSLPDVSDPTPALSGALDGVTAATAGLGDALGPLTAIFGADE
jgi:hypothetical protein